jgi:hypothetical protein
MMLYSDTPPKDEVALMRQITRHAAWDVVAEEEQLRAAHKVVASAKALLLRGNYLFSLQDAADEYEEQADDPDTADEWVKSIVGYSLHSVDYHEKSLVRAHAVLAAVKSMLARGNYTEIDLDEISKEMEQRYYNNQGIGD